jgi:energy-dependent translational throttle protein EttA
MKPAGLWESLLGPARAPVPGSAAAATARTPDGVSRPSQKKEDRLSWLRTMSSQYIFTMHRLSKVHPPDKTVLHDLTLAFFPGAKIGVLGYNGAGKSTLLRIMAGVDQEFRGRAELAPGARVGMLEQEPILDESKDVKGNVEDGVADTRALLDRFNELAANYSEQTAEEFADIQARIDAADAWNLDTQLEYAMDALRLPPPDAEVASLSGGERRRVALCRLLLGAPDLLLLDEPTNHLDAESVAWLEHHLAEYGGTVVAVTHDRYFLDNVAGWILELDRGRGIPYQGNYSSWLEQKQARLAHEARSEKGRARTIAAELEWVRTNPKGRRTKSKARLARYEELVAEERNVKLDEVQIHIPPGPRLGERVLTAANLCKGFGERLLIDELSFDLPRAGIVGVIGANGAGKTTLFKMITGGQSPDAGTLELGESVQLAYVDQSREALDPQKTVWEEISDGLDQLKVGDRVVNSRQYTAGFNFKGQDQQAKLANLSGGERNRVHLAKLLRTGGNLLLLDEPTNDLDVDTLRALEQALLAFPGCAMIISHDRWFLDRIATHVLAFEGDSQVRWFEGNFEAYEEHRRAMLGAAADRPHRITYKRLVRG